MSEGRSSSKNDPISRRQFVAGAATAIVSAIVGGIVGSQAFPRSVTETVTREATKTLTSTATVSTTIPTTITSTTTKETTTTVEKEVIKEIKKSGMIIHNPSVCTGCGTCLLMCSLYHEGVSSPALARACLDVDPFSAEYAFNVCRQCPAPSCYYACPLRDEALCIDEKTGARYINPDKCIGCKSCIKACPFDPPRIKFNKEKNISFKCDLCKGREGGPICVEYCPNKALTFVPAEER